jgi:hypothetical protein
MVDCCGRAGCLIAGSWPRQPRDSGCSLRWAHAPGAAGDFAENATLTITGGSGKYAGATGTIALKGEAHNVFGGPGVGT